MLKLAYSQKIAFFTFIAILLGNSSNAKRTPVLACKLHQGPQVNAKLTHRSTAMLKLASNQKIVFIMLFAIYSGKGTIVKGPFRTVFGLTDHTI